MQITHDDPPYANLQIQVNKGTGIPSLKRLASRKGKDNGKSDEDDGGTSLVTVLIPDDGTYTADMVRQALVAGMSRAFAIKE